MKRAECTGAADLVRIGEPSLSPVYVMCLFDTTFLLEIPPLELRTISQATSFRWKGLIIKTGLKKGVAAALG
jgi:hypothetical protein